MNCPFCSSQVIDKGNQPNGGILFVAEECDSSTESYDWEITQYQCINDPEHTFYAKKLLTDEKPVVV